MANQWLTGTGTPSTGIGQVTDYYRDTASNLVYYRENAFTWVNVPAFTPNPDGIGTTWLHGNVPPLTGQGSDGDYYYDEVQLIVYRKDGATWVPKGSLDFIGLYGVQWGNGLGAPANTTPLNNLPAGSFYLDVVTSDIYYKGPSMSWELKGQLGDGGGGGGGSQITLVTTLSAVTQTDVTSAVTPSVIFELGTSFGEALQDLAPKNNPTFTGTPQAPTVATATSNNIIATTGFAHAVANAAEGAAKTYADGLVVNLWDDRGTFSAAAGSWPTSAHNGSGIVGTIMKGDTWSISTGGTLTGGKVVATGDVIRALVDGAGNTSADWGITENNLGYVAENSTNKATDLSSPDDTKYPTTKAIVDNVLDILLTDYTDALVNSAVSTTDSSLTAFGKLQKQITDAVANAVSLSALRYVVTTPAIVANAYLVTSTDVNAYGNKILKLTNATAIAVTLPTPATLGATVGDSFNIRQGGAGGIAIIGTVSGTTTTSSINTTMTLIAESSTSWMSVGG